MGIAALLLLLVLMHKHAHPTGLRLPGNATADAQAAARAQAAAAAAAARAAHTNDPADHHAAAQAATQAAVLTNHAASAAQRAQSSPAPWPSVTPKDLPPWPSGWMPAQPPPTAVVNRAWQLLPTLWQRGAGTRTVEKTGGDWYSYVATPMGNGIKGVTAHKPRPGAMPIHTQPSGNA